MKPTTKYSLIAAGFILAGVAGWRMWELFQKEQLWSYWPLAFFTGGWLGLRLLFTRKWTPEDRNWRWLGLSALSGILLSLGFPPFPLTPLLFVAFVPLLMVEDELSQSPKSARKIFRFAYNTFAIWNILVTYWVANTAFAAGIVAIFLNAFFMTGPFVLFHLAKKYIPRLAYLAFIAFWISFEMLHLHWEISWSWLNLGNAFAEFPAWVQWYEYTGIFGGTFWVLLANVLIFKFLKNRKAAAPVRPKWELQKIILLLLAPLLFSLYKYFTYVEKGRPVEVVVVQPNFEPHYEKFSIPDNQQLRRFITLAENSLTQSTDYLVFPETSFGMVEVNSFEQNTEIKTLKKFLENYPRLKLVTGIDGYKIFEKSEPATEHTRTQIRNGRDTFRYEIYNAAIQLTGDSLTKIPYYKKSKLVPGPEIFPYRKLLFFFEPIVKSLDGSVEGLGTQSTRSTFESAVGKVAPVICYESVFGEFSTGYVKNGAEAIFIMTNDGWWDKTAGHIQHLKYASLRAIETRRPIARSANTGISAFIDQKGVILQPTKYNEATAITGKILFNDERTFYEKWGDIIGRISVFTALILMLNLLVKGLINRTENK